MVSKEPILIASEDPIPLESLELSRRAYNALKRRGYQHLDQVGQLGYDSLLTMHGVGVKTAEEIWEKLISYLESHAVPYSVSTVSSDFEETAQLRDKGTPIERLDLPPSVCRELLRQGYEHVELVAQAGYSGIKNLPGVSDKQAREIWLATFAYSKTLDKKIPIRPTLELPNLDLASLRVEALPLSVRARNALLRANVLTISDLCVLGRESIETIRGLGEAASQEIWETLGSILSNPDLVSYCRQFETPIIPEMTDNDYTLTGIPNLPNLLPGLFRQISVRGAKDARDYEVLKRRFGLEGSKIYTLDEIGLFYDGISRERVRQIERRAISRLKRFLVQGNFRRPPFGVHKSVVNEARTLYEALTNTAEEVETESRLFKLISARYGLEELSRETQASLRLLFRVYSFSELPASHKSVGANISVPPAWVVRRGEVRLGQIGGAIRLIYNILRDNVIPMSYFDLKVRINKRRRKNPINDLTMKAALRLCADVEALGEDRYQICFERLRGCGSFAYRVLWDAGAPLSFSEVYKEVNRRLTLASEAPVDRETLRNAMLGEERLSSDRKRWGVAERDELVQATVVDIMLEYFHKTGESATSSQLLKYVSQYKKIRKESIYHYLTTRQDKFVRVGPGLYQPVAWGYAKPYEPERDRRAKKWSRDKVAELIEGIFRERGSESMPLSELVAAVAERMGMPSERRYYPVRNSPAIMVQPISKGSHRLLARFVPEFRDLPAMKKTKRKQLWKEMEDLLRQSPSLSLPQQELLRKVRASVGVSRSTFYRYVSEMPNIIRSPTAEQGIICTLSVEKTLDSFPELEAITNTKLVHELRLAIGLLDGEAIEMGLFHLGKLFEREVRRFLDVAVARKVFPVSKRDRGRLADMLDCLERNGVITNKRTLDYLRQERNVHAHEVLDDRESLRRDAPAIAKLYIQNIVYLWKERCKLEGKYFEAHGFAEVWNGG